MAATTIYSGRVAALRHINVTSCHSSSSEIPVMSLCCTRSLGLAVRPASSSHDHDTESTDDDEDAMSHLEPVDIDANLLESIMESMRAQNGEAGPAGAQLVLLNVATPVEDPKVPSNHTS